MHTNQSGRMQYVIVRDPNKLHHCWLRNIAADVPESLMLGMAEHTGAGYVPYVAVSLKPCHYVVISMTLLPMAKPSQRMPYSINQDRKASYANAQRNPGAYKPKEAPDTHNTIMQAPSDELK